MIYSFFNMYHLIRFGFTSIVNITIMITYIIVATALIVYSLILLNQIDWTTPLLDSQINIFNTINSNDINI